MSPAWEIRPPVAGEEPLCRMLLPEVVGESGRRFLFAMRPAAPRLGGAVSFWQAPGTIGGLRVHVVPPLRRQGIGRLLMEASLAAAKAAGARRAQAHLTADETAGQALLHQCGFHRAGTFTTASAARRNAEFLRTDEQTDRLIALLRERNRWPAEARLIPLAEAPAPEILRLWQDEVLLDPLARPDLLAYNLRERYAPDSPVICLGSRVAGFTLVRADNGGAEVVAKAVVPDLRGRWPNLWLTRATIDWLDQNGHTQVRFGWTSEVHDTAKLAVRLGARILAVRERWVRELG